MQPNLREILLHHAVERMGGSNSDFAFIKSLEICDIRKWQIIKWAIKKQKLTMDFYLAVCKRSYRPPLRRQITRELIEEVASILDYRLMGEYYYVEKNGEVVFDEERVDFVSDLEKQIRIKFCAIYAINPDINISKEIKKIFPLLERSKY